MPKVGRNDAIVESGAAMGHRSTCESSGLVVERDRLDPATADREATLFAWDPVMATGAGQDTPAIMVGCDQPARRSLMINELHPDEIESVLHRHHVGRLACLVAGEPYLVPITYAYRDGVLYGHTMPGQKLDAMRAEPRVAFEVDERWEADTWRSVVVRGVFEELAAAARSRRGARRAARGLPGRLAAW